MTIILHGTNGVTTAGITLGSTAIASTGAELNILDGVTSTAAELNILDGVTSTTAELNILDGVTSTTAELNILDGVTSTAAELNILDGVTATAAEINLIDGGTARGTTAVADGDGFLTNDGGTMRMTKVDTLATYIATKVAATSSSAEATLNATELVMTGIPAGVQWVRVMLNNVRLQDDSNLRIYMGIASGTDTYATTGFTQSLDLGETNAIYSDEDNGRWIMLTGNSSSDRFYGFVEITRIHTTNTWLCSYSVTIDDGDRHQTVGGGVVVMAAELTRIKLGKSTGSTAMSGGASLVWGF